jgi:hypothetical protein
MTTNYTTRVQAPATRICESAGPTVLTLGALADASIMVRTGTAILGFAPGATVGNALTSNGTVWTNTVGPWNIGTTSTAGLCLSNTTAATGGATVQYSPCSEYLGTAWTGAASQVAGWRIGCRPVSAATITSQLSFSSSINGAAYAQVGYLTSAGAMWAAKSYEASGALDYRTTPLAGLTLSNTTASTSGVTIQNSPTIDLYGAAWKANTTESQSYNWRLYNSPLNGTSFTQGYFYFSLSVAGAAYTNPVYFTSAGAIGALSSITAGAYTMIHYSNQATGFGTTAVLKNSAATPLLLCNSGATDAASGTVCSINYDRGAASITNAATMRLCSFTWTNNSDAYAEVAAVYCNGHIWSALALSVAGDLGAGIASTTTFTNATVADGGNDATLGKAPAAAGRSGWLKTYVGTTAVAIPYWPAA